MRDTLINLLDREFVEGPEATGIVSLLANFPNSNGKPQESDKLGRELTHRRCCQPRARQVFLPFK
jgi:hypothetical protein